MYQTLVYYTFHLLLYLYEKQIKQKKNQSHDFLLIDLPVNFFVTKQERFS